jgi:hypothetical protein
LVITVSLSSLQSENKVKGFLTFQKLATINFKHVFTTRYLKEKLALLEEERNLEKESIQKYEVTFLARVSFHILLNIFQILLFDGECICNCVTVQAAFEKKKNKILHPRNDERLACYSKHSKFISDNHSV